MKQRIRVSWLNRLGFGLILVFGLLVVPGVSYAHLVEMLSSFPENGAIVAEAPEVITAVFNEEMQTDTSTFVVFNAEGQQVDDGNGGVDLNDPEHASMLVSVPPLPEGVYTVRWYVVLLDGDATVGSFNFFVGDEQAASAANFVPIPDGSEVESTAVPNAGANNIPWLVAGILVSALIVSGTFLLVQRRNKSA